MLKVASQEHFSRRAATRIDRSLGSARPACACCLAAVGVGTVSRTALTITHRLAQIAIRAGEAEVIGIVAAIGIGMLNLRCVYAIMLVFAILVTTSLIF